MQSKPNLSTSTTSELYRHMFSLPDYSRHTKWDRRYRFAVQNLKDVGGEILDVGSGRGTFARYASSHKLKVFCSDVDNFTEYDSGRPFLKLDLTSDSLSVGKWDAITCLDVLEHLNSNDLDEAIASLSRMSSRAIITVANHEEIQEGIDLHLIKKPIAWWKSKFDLHFRVREAKYLYQKRSMGFALESKYETAYSIVMAAYNKGYDLRKVL